MSEAAEIILNALPDDFGEDTETLAVDLIHGRAIASRRRYLGGRALTEEEADKVMDDAMKGYATEYTSMAVARYLVFLLEAGLVARHTVHICGKPVDFWVRRADAVAVAEPS